MILYTKSIKAQNGLYFNKNADVTSNYYHTNQKGIIDAGPYSGLNMEEASELNKLEREDLLKKNKADAIKKFQEKISAKTTKFGLDYVLPTMKAAGSFTPAGVAIGLSDAYDEYKRGNTGWAIAGAGMEALPFAGKYIGKGAKRLIKPLFKNTNKAVASPEAFVPFNKGTSIDKKIRTAMNRLEDIYYAKDYDRTHITKSLEDLKKRLNTPEGKKRLKGINASDYDISTLIIKEDPKTYGASYGDAGPVKNTIGLNPNLPAPSLPAILRHEIQHKFQKGTGKNIIDDLLGMLELRDFNKKVITYKPNVNPVRGYDVYAMFQNNSNAKDYFLHGSNGKERSAFLSELQQYLLDNKYISNAYDNITPELVKRVFMGRLGKSNMYPLRIFNIMKPTNKNFNLLSGTLNKLPAVTAGIVGYQGLNNNK